MKKNVIAMAVAAALVAPLAAHAEVTVSGVLQAELDMVSGDSGDGNYLTNGNRGKLEFAASEDLGNGLKAFAKYGMNVGVDGEKTKSSFSTHISTVDGVTTSTWTNTWTSGGVSHTWKAGVNDNTLALQRDAYVGLSGSFGAVMFGTMSNPYKSSTVGWDPLLETGAQARGQFGMSKLHNGYTGNALAYANKFGMAKVVAAVVLDESTDANGDTNGDNAVSFSVNMPVGPVEVAVAYISTPAADVSNQDDASTKVGVKYTAGPMSVAVQHEMVGGDTVGGNDQTFTYLNGTYTMGANTFVAAYGMNTVDTTGGDLEHSYMSVAVAHNFSKSTMAYAAYLATSKDGATTTDDTAIAFGLRVGF